MGTRTSTATTSDAPTTGTAPTPATPATMRAVHQDRYGGPDTLEVRSDAPVPVPGPGEVLVQVQAAGIDAGTWHVMTGEPLIARFAFGLRRPAKGLGLALSGTVAEVGPGAPFAIGDRVLGTATGALAEYVVARADRLVAAPEDLDLTAAAALPVSANTAMEAVRDVGRARPGDRVLVIGASGGVGSYAVQVAAAVGAEVTATASAAKADLVRELGAGRVIDHRTTELTPETTGGGFDLVVDIAGNRRVRDLRRLLTPAGTLVIVGGDLGGRLTGGIHRQLGAMLLSPFVRQRLTTFISSDKAEVLGRVADLVRQGLVRPPLDRSYPLAEVRAALEDLHAGRVSGKVVVTP